MIAVGVEVTSCGHFVEVRGHYAHRPEPPDNLLIWVIAGRGFVRSEATDAAVGPGTLISLVPGQAHTYGSDPQDPWTIVWVHFDGPAAGDWMARLRQGRADRVVTSLGGDDRLRARWLELVATFRGPRPEDQALAHPLLAGVLGLIAHGLASEEGSGGGRPGTRLAAVQAHVQAHLAQPLTVADLARVARLSPAQLTRVMNARLGCSPLAYVLDQRMAQAGALLRETDLPVKAVAADVGYDDPYYFSRLFRRRVGQTPTAYRGWGRAKAEGGR